MLVISHGIMCITADALTAVQVLRSRVVSMLRPDVPSIIVLNYLIWHIQ